LTEFLQHVVNGVSLGTIYALIALGYTMVYGVLKLINFAHGDVYMVAAFAGFYAAATALACRHAPDAGQGGGWSSWASMAVAGALGLGHRALRLPAAARPGSRLTALITAIGVSFLLEYGFQLPSLQRAGAQTSTGALAGGGRRAGWLNAPGAAALPAELPARARRPASSRSPSPGVDWTVLGGVHVSQLRRGVASWWPVGFMLGLQWIVFRTRFGDGDARRLLRRPGGRG